MTQTKTNRYLLLISEYQEGKNEGIRLMYEMFRPYNRLVIQANLSARDVAGFITANYMVEHGIRPSDVKAQVITDEFPQQSPEDTYFLSFKTENCREWLDVTIEPILGEATIEAKQMTGDASVKFNPNGEEES